MPDNSAIWYRVGLILAPLLLVKAVALMLDAGSPQSAEADQTVVPAPALQLPLLATSGRAPQATRADEPALIRMQVLQSTEVGPSPFYLEKRSEPRLPAAPSRMERFDFRVTGIMKSTDGNLALIDGQFYRVGDAISPGWAITHIDSEDHAVTVRHTTTNEQITRVVIMHGS